MTKKELVELIESWENLNYLIEKIALNPGYYQLTMDIALNDSHQKSWRAAYLIDKINDLYPDLLKPYLNELIEQVKKEKSESKKRHFLKLISMNELTNQQQGFLFDYCIQTFTSPEPVAVRVHALQIAYNISLKEPSLIPELILVIENEIEYHSSVGICSRGKKLLERLQKQGKN